MPKIVIIHTVIALMVIVSIHNPVGICTTELQAELTEHVAASMSLCYVATGDHYDKMRAIFQ
jgi:hypothetical protein